MKRYLKAILKRLWRLTGPARRPLARKLGLFLAEVVRAEVGPQLGAISTTVARVEAPEGPLRAIEHSVNLARCTSDAFAAEANLILDSLIREVARLQLQVEALQASLDDAGARDGLSIVGEADPHTGLPPHAAKAG
jgi:hypothetical protein